MVRDISRPINVGEEIKGVPIRASAQQQVTVYMLQPDGTYAAAYRTTALLPDRSKLYAIRADSGLLANNQFNIDLNDDGTLKDAKLTSSNQGPAATTQLGSSAAEVLNAAATYDQNRVNAEAAALKAATTLQQQQQAQAGAEAAQVLAYRQAVEAVIVAQAQYDALPPSTSTADRVAAQSDLRILELKANQAAQVIGRPAPFPDVYGK
jgi:hypothetical protein